MEHPNSTFSGLLQGVIPGGAGGAGGAVAPQLLANNTFFVIDVNE